MGVVLSRGDEDIPAFICMQTSKRNCIVNEQRRIILEQEINLEKIFAKNFSGKFHGQATRAYNCHGLTFASKRTGIYDQEMIEMILKDEYIEIKDLRSLEVGDVIIYYTENIITHSGVVIDVKTQENSLSLIQPVIRVTSKTRCYREIEHFWNETQYGSVCKFYRISHDEAIILQ